MKKKLSGLCFAINALAFLFIGLRFTFGRQFLSFHSDAIQTRWVDLGTDYQTLFLGMMRTEGAGFLATAAAISLLLLIPFRRGETWSIWAIVFVGLVEHLPTLLATWHVAQTTEASPPWAMTLTLMGLLIVGLIFALLDGEQKQSSTE